VTAPQTAEAFVGKKGGREKRWCTRTGCVRALVRTEKGHRSKLPPCVESQIQDMYGVCEVGFLKESVRKRSEAQGCRASVTSLIPCPVSDRVRNGRCSILS